ncbi:unnamed protein product [Acanthoscelides obtectus]|uniref:Uncharacterized protein n=1 Tax=Acanthoscelides obtectus TaxID=200917 RepID=A0A9P0L291_ACAOB|nr:unnamed protein product [Acanthoscelides obtectus]CAK1635150.1 hypothetical protein AOBTE_LOCUS9103 [Acanthoscelides obtectus]
MCKKRKRMCYLFSSPLRTMIFSQFYSLGDLQQQREYIARFVLSQNPKHRTTNSNDPRRKQTHYFFLPLEGIRQLVCKKMFLGTLGISEKVCRTAIKKLNRTTSVLEKENRGDRRELQSSRDILIRKSIIEHINRFPRVESHYCRKSSTKQYLHEDLSLSTMYHMCKLEDQQTKGSFSLYRKIFRFMNLSFHKPKKDQCGLCKCYREGSEEVKANLEKEYLAHILEKETVREIKNSCKEKAKNDTKISNKLYTYQFLIIVPYFIKRGLLSTI